MFAHHTDNLLFRGNSALALTPGSLNTLLSPHYRHIDVAALVPLLWSRFGSGSYSRVITSLVNVCSPFSGYSTGFIDPPPDSIFTLNSHLLFTFVVLYDTTWDTNSLQVNHTSIRSTYWGSGKEPRKFLTIGINSTEASSMGLMHVHANELKYLYRLLGVIFRSTFLHYTPAQIADLKRGQTIPLGKDVYYYRDAYLGLPLTSIFRSPYWAWGFNKKVWQVAPNLIPYKDVDPILALYYFLFLAKDVVINKPSFDGISRLLGTSGTGGISEVLVKSLLAFTQYLNDPADYQFELNDLLAANVLASLVYSGKSKIRLNRNTYKDDMEQNLVALADQLRMSLKQGNLAQLFSPYDKTALSILHEDQAFVTKLMSGISA